MKSGDVELNKRRERIIYMTKRIAGAPGDSIESAGGSFVVPEDCYYVLGDNAAYSMTHGIGKIRLREMRTL